jgi:hypothetical protein
MVFFWFSNYESRNFLTKSTNFHEDAKTVKETGKMMEWLYEVENDWFPVTSNEEEVDKVKVKLSLCSTN